MKTYRGFGELPSRRAASAVTIGNFDGVHRGHRALIRRLMKKAEAVSGLSTIV
ncbi:MAG: adenylyltransferase/cytidyltransferase family protein, partial [Gammaproteobacteria bacterium]